ncbi:MAG TPA: DUF1501 domain-containing protein [Chloroflexota bacterium]|nr:DUF1501 domain-containing protein [Chloroflexota bacterium]
MARDGKQPVMVVVQLTGGNDFMNTLVPYTNGHYYDNRKTLVVHPHEAIPINDTLAFHPMVAPLKDLYDNGKVAVVQGIGYPNSSRSHFRAMDIWHTCEPEKISNEGWVGRAIRELDPEHENVLTGVNIGRGLPRAMMVAGVPVTSASDLDNYGLLTGISNAEQRESALATFKRIYSPAIGNGPVMDYLAQTGTNVLRGVDRIKEAPARYSSSVQYPDNPIGKNLRDVARVYLAGLGTRILYTAQGGYDTHANQGPNHPKLLGELAQAIGAFFADLDEHHASDDLIMLVFTEFGRRIKDNGSGTDHGSGGGAFIIGNRVKGGLYAEYPSLEPSQWLNGEDLRHTIDFRGVYATLLEQWLGLEAAPIVGGTFEQIQPFVH